MLVIVILSLTHIPGKFSKGGGRIVGNCINLLTNLVVALLLLFEEPILVPIVPPGKAAIFPIFGIFGSIGKLPAQGIGVCLDKVVNAAVGAAGVGEAFQEEGVFEQGAFRIVIRRQLDIAESQTNVLRAVAARRANQAGSRDVRNSIAAGGNIGQTQGGVAADAANQQGSNAAFVIRHADTGQLDVGEIQIELC